MTDVLIEIILTIVVSIALFAGGCVLIAWYEDWRKSWPGDAP